MVTATVKIAPSILAADFADLGTAIRAVESAGADQIHVDVMDGHFVPNISIGPVVVESIRKITNLPLDVHLMISDPDKYVSAFAEAGSNVLTFHIEAHRDVRPLVEKIHKSGLRAGIAIKPGSPLEELRPALLLIDIVLVMSVEPGFGGQAFLEPTIDRIKTLRTWIDETGSKADLSVDGGINHNNARKIVNAGASVLVAGNSIFRAEAGAGDALRKMQQLALGS